MKQEQADTEVSHLLYQQN